MCGLAGIVTQGYSLNREKSLFENLMLLAYFRGVHGYGMMKIDDNLKRITTQRQVGPVVNHLKQKYFQDFLAYNQYKTSHNKVQGYSYSQEVYTRGGPSVYMGHTRQATVGKLSVENFHPFAKSNLIGFHNGTAIGLTMTHETDSESIFERLNSAIEGLDKDNDIVDALGAELALIEQECSTISYAFQIWIRKTRKIYFLRNKQRPLVFSWLNGNTIAWSSEDILLELAVRKSEMFESKVHNKVMQEDKVISKYFERADEYQWEPRPFALIAIDPDELITPHKCFSVFDLSEVLGKSTKEKKEDPIYSGDPNTNVPWSI